MQSLTGDCTRTRGKDAFWTPGLHLCDEKIPRIFGTPYDRVAQSFSRHPRNRRSPLSTARQNSEKDVETSQDAEFHLSGTPGKIDGNKSDAIANF